MEDFRDKYWQGRASRRRFLAAAGTAGAGIASLGLVGCGDDNSKSGGATVPASGSRSPESTDPFAGVKRGGVYKLAGSDPTSIDPYGSNSAGAKGNASYTYGRLYKFKTDPKIAATSLLPSPDIAASAEASPDGLKWTIKLRPGVKFHNVAPVNGRALTTEDVKFSWGRATAATNPNRSQLAFVDSVEYPDASTVTFSLSSPRTQFLEILADTNLLQIMPAEADGKFNPLKQMIGSGPWIFDSYRVGEKLVYKKNPDWYETGYPLMDGVEVAIIPEYVNKRVQFVVGALDEININGDDLIDVRDQVKGATIYGKLLPYLSHFYFDPDPSSPVQDSRVRQAISMCIDRDALTDLAYNTKKLKSAGFDVKSGWNNIIPAGIPRFWLDPQGKDMGDGGKYWKYDVAEAKKLMAAAGLGGGLTIKYQYPGNTYPASFYPIAEAQIGYLAAIGIKAAVETQDYSSRWISQTSFGNFQGIAFGSETAFLDAGQYPLRQFTDNPLNHGKVKDAELAKLANDQQVAPTEQARKTILWDLQRKHAEKMYYVPSQWGAATDWTGYQPHIRNFLYQTPLGVYAAPGEELPYRWSAKV